MSLPEGLFEVMRHLLKTKQIERWSEHQEPHRWHFDEWHGDYAVGPFRTTIRARCSCGQEHGVTQWKMEQLPLNEVLRMLFPCRAIVVASKEKERHYHRSYPSVIPPEPRWSPYTH